MSPQPNSDFAGPDEKMARLARAIFVLWQALRPGLPEKVGSTDQQCGASIADAGMSAVQPLPLDRIRLSRKWRKWLRIQPLSLRPEGGLEFAFSDPWRRITWCLGKAEVEEWRDGLRYRYHLPVKTIASLYFIAVGDAVVGHEVQPFCTEPVDGECGRYRTNRQRSSDTCQQCQWKNAACDFCNQLKIVDKASGYQFSLPGIDTQGGRTALAPTSTGGIPYETGRLAI
jgi:hypothetical protein